MDFQTVPAPTIILHKFPAITNAYRKQFDAFWNMAREPIVTEKTQITLENKRTTERKKIMSLTYYSTEDFSLQRETLRNTDRSVGTKFFCPEESRRYAGALEQLVFNRLRDQQRFPTIVEFGSETGEPVISALLNSSYLGSVSGYEINAEAVEMANDLTEEFDLSRQYKVHHKSFFDAENVATAEYIIANPPYLPSEKREELLLPDLCGGKEGIDISKALLSMGCPNVLLLISSYSNPHEILRHAENLGYRIADFLITKMSFGVYSRQDIVRKRIHEMRTEGKAFFTDNCYLVGGALFTKEDSAEPDLSEEFKACISLAPFSH